MKLTKSFEVWCDCGSHCRIQDGFCAECLHGHVIEDYAIIETPEDCPHRISKGGEHAVCGVDGVPDLLCEQPDKFPEGCPLWRGCHA